MQQVSIKSLNIPLTELVVSPQLNVHPVGFNQRRIPHHQQNPVHARSTVILPMSTVDQDELILHTQLTVVHWSTQNKKQDRIKSKRKTIVLALGKLRCESDLRAIFRHGYSSLRRWKLETGSNRIQTAGARYSDPHLPRPRNPESWSQTWIYTKPQNNNNCLGWAKS